VALVRQSAGRLPGYWSVIEDAYAVEVEKVQLDEFLRLRCVGGHPVLQEGVAAALAEAVVEVAVPCHEGVGDNNRRHLQVRELGEVPYLGEERLASNLPMTMMAGLVLVRAGQAPG